MVSAGLVTSVAGVAWMSPASAATTVGPIDFELPEYTTDPGNIDGQEGWSKTGGYDVEVASVSDFDAAEKYGFGTQALRASNEITSGSFGDHTFSPGVAEEAGEGDAVHFYTASFTIGTALATEQTGMTMSVSPDHGDGGRMSYLRFDDMEDGVHVTFFDTVNAGTAGETTQWRSTDIATLSRDQSHSIKFEIAFVDGAANDVVKIFVDGVLAHTGTTWEDYYRFDSEQLGNLNEVPLISKLLFRTSGAAVAANAGNGYLFDRVSLSSSATAPVPSAPPTAPSEDYDGNLDCADIDPTWEEFKIEGVPDEGLHEDPDSDLEITISNSSSQTFDWTSNDDISAVLVKGGAGGGGVQYTYAGVDDLGDTGLHALVHEGKDEYYGISHVTFCYKVGGDTVVDTDTDTETPENTETPEKTGTPEETETPQPATVIPHEDQPPATPQPAVIPAGDEAEVLGVTLTTLPRTGAAATPALVLFGGLGLALGLAMLVLAHRRTPITSS